MLRSASSSTEQRVVRIRNGKASTPEALLARIEADGPRPSSPAALAKRSAVNGCSASRSRTSLASCSRRASSHASCTTSRPSAATSSPSSDFEVYDRIGALARQRAAAAKSAVEIHERQLAAFAGATEAARAAAEVRRGELLELHHALDTARPEEQRLVAAIAEADAQARAASALAAELDQIRVPRAVTQLTEKLDGALVAARVATEAVATATGLAALDAEVDSARPPELAGPRRAHRDAAPAPSSTARTAEAATRPMPHASPISRHGPRRISGISKSGSPPRGRTPRALASHLVAGEPCPVCHQTVTSIPKRKRPAALTKVEGEVKEARRIAAGAREAVERATHAHADAAAAHKQLEEQLAAQRALADAFPDAPTIASVDADRHDAGGAPGRGARAKARRRSRAATRRAGRRAVEAVFRLPATTASCGPDWFRRRR